jgi:hypothetical protein
VSQANASKAANNDAIVAIQAIRLMPSFYRRHVTASQINDAKELALHPLRLAQWVGGAFPKANFADWHGSSNHRRTDRFM